MTTPMTTPTPSSTPRNSIVVRLGDPAVRAAIGDIEVMRYWETLRRTERPLAASDLAARHRVSAKAMQHALDLLVSAGLATRLRATGRERRITYRTTGRELYVAWEKSDPSQLDFVADQRLRLREMSQRMLDLHDGDRSVAQLLKRGSSVYANLMLDDAEIKRMLAAINTIEELTTAAQLRADAAERDGDSQLIGVDDGAGTPRAGPAGQQAWLPYHLSLEFRPLRHVEPTLPTYSLFDAEYIPTLVERRERSAAGILTQRELEVARLLVGGESRPAIARRLGLSINTIAATTKRIYAKLGVHSRAEFVSRMKAA